MPSLVGSAQVTLNVVPASMPVLAASRVMER